MANERGRLTNSSNVTQLILADSSNKASIQREETFIECGLVKGPIPLTDTDNTAMQQVKGRLRRISIEGYKVGTQAEIEDFIKTIELWVNRSGFGTDWRYYPLFRATYNDPLILTGNTLAASNLQSGYYGVLPDSFNYIAEIRDIGLILRYNLSMFEGKTVRDYLGI